MQITKTIVQSLSLKETFSLSFMKGNHFGDNETYRFANIETIRRIQRAGDKYSGQRADATVLPAYLLRRLHK